MRASIRPPFAALVLTLAACAQVPQEDLANNPDYQELRAPSVQLAERHAASPPLALIDIPVRATNPEHEVKKIPRRYTPVQTAMDPITQNITLLAPTLSLNFAGQGQGFTGPNGTFSLTGAPPDTN